ILRALDNQKEDAMKQAFKAFYRMVFNQHAYSLDLAGTPQTLKPLTPTGLKRLHASHMKNSQLVFTYCGDQDFSVVHAYMKEVVKELDPRKAPKKKKSSPKALLGKREHLEFKREQTQIIIGTSAYPIGCMED